MESMHCRDQKANSETPHHDDAEIRQEYGKLGEDFHLLVHGFGFDLPNEIWKGVQIIMVGCECLDRSVDDLPSKEGRINLAKQIVHTIDSGTVESGFNTELATHLRAMNQVWPSVEARQSAAVNVGRIYAISEQLRDVSSRQKYIDLVCEEGRCFLDMFVPLIRPHCPEKFLHFFLELGAVGDLVDKLVDARADSVRGEHPFRPTVWHHLRLLAAVMVRTPKILRLYPNRLVLCRWASHYFIPKNHRSAILPSLAKHHAANQYCSNDSGSISAKAGN